MEIIVNRKSKNKVGSVGVHNLNKNMLIDIEKCIHLIYTKFEEPRSRYFTFTLFPFQVTVID